MDKNLLQKLYVEQGKTIKEIAEKFNVSNGYIQYRLKKFNLPTRARTHHITTKLNEMIGKRFGRLVVLSQQTNACDRMSKWLCQCDCGKTHITRMRNLKNGECKSCGCLKLKRCGDINGSYFWGIKNGAKIRSFSFNITIEDAWNQYKKQNGLCSISGEKISLSKDYKDRTTTASLDRIDSTRGYELENIQWIHKDLNTMKMAMPEEKFLNWVKKIYEFKKL